MPLLSLPPICVRWVRIITQYVTACVCHLCVFGVLVCWWSACSQAYHQQTRTPNTHRWACSQADHQQTRTPNTHRWACSQADHQQTRTPNTHRWHIHAATYCVIIRIQRTQISERNSNGTKHSGGPPEDGREKRPKRVGVLYLQTRF